MVFGCLDFLVSLSLSLRRKPKTRYRRLNDAFFNLYAFTVDDLTEKY